ncbi:hypothetical protein BRYFOR_08019 [Marvinbryantia formatexigens DSM 14469]|uniref:Cadherin-like beta-sandwich-like domain-containing protein n=1 Tax=Marvinbryantia formatexigens DSM 14469 TaxID=478749 RepID=C6LHA9_9FIRM|nr:cadherin-like beta sandwich domain-containing protein [Marvinbryantia formatexigens]EET59896.1 hypothetical protein BRYFOR_08019 [Marvinbryantia formatexigens DSM 14469]UWO25928.1 cadherin-like beta sandwich domain-containing protein [Marvinbryantia formatexigens DSM 14469]SDF43352.1 Cadherin-like beta sandwich domain-containing protein [Marvinbryantia formatexigens]
MKTRKRTFHCAVSIIVAALWLMCMTASASSGDNSLYSLGLENASSCSPEFVYSTWEYNVTVPAGTTELLLDPVTSDATARITDISGTQIGEDGTTTVYITVEAANGARVSYTLYVTTEEGEAQTETQATESQEAQQASEEAQRQSEQAASEAAQRQIEYEQAKNQVTTLTNENEDLTNRIDLLMKIMYGLVGFAVLLLFFLINQSLRNKDLKEDLKEARGQAEDSREFTRKEQNMQQTYYYNPQQNMPNGMDSARKAPERTYTAQPVADASASVRETFGNASQVLHAQPGPGQVNAPVQKQEEAAKPETPAAPQSAAPRRAEDAQGTEEPVMVQGQSDEPDVNVEMIDL